MQVIGKVHYLFKILKQTERWTHLIISGTDSRQSAEWDSSLMTHMFTVTTFHAHNIPVIDRRTEVFR